MSDFNYIEYLRDNPLLRVDPNEELITERKKEGYDDREDESVSARKGKEADKKQSFKDRRDDSYGKMGKRDAEKKGKNKINKESVSVDENARTDAEEEGYEDGFDDAKDDIEDTPKKMKKSELKAKIRETILSELSEESQYNASIYSEAEEDVDVDVDLGDIEDEVNVDVEPDEIDIEKKAVRTTVDVGLSPEEEVIQDSLKAAMDSANALGNDKLADQIGNTITFFTREYVVGRNND